MASEEPVATEGVESTEEELPEEVQPEPRFDVIYSCLRCGTNVGHEELSRLPEIKCICGFRVFSKVRPPLVKNVQAL
jgi:DNA-directed RNA polymerase subunit P